MFKSIYKPFRWVGGKTPMLSDLLPLISTAHTTYCEPYAGSASLFFAKKPSPVELLNDLNDRIVNFYRVLQSDDYKYLMERLNRTLYSRLDFMEAVDILRNPNADKVDKAWAFFVSQNQSYGAKEGTEEQNPTWGFSLKQNQASLFHKKIALMDVFRDRIRNAQIESMDAIDFIKKFDDKETLFYVDPPYPLETRKNQKYYRVEVDQEHISNLIEVLQNIKGQAIVSTYSFDEFDKLLECGYHKYGFNKSETLSGNFRINRQGLEKRNRKAAIVRTEVIYYRIRQNTLF